MSDVQMIRLRTEIVAAYESRLENGLITANDYLVTWNRENTARISKEIHELELIWAYYKIQSLKGNR